jgi:hypothetical protein
LEKAFKSLRSEAERLGVKIDGIGEGYTAENLQKLKDAI